MKYSHLQVGLACNLPHVSDSLVEGAAREAVEGRLGVGVERRRRIRGLVLAFPGLMVRSRDCKYLGFVFFNRTLGVHLARSRESSGERNRVRRPVRKYSPMSASEDIFRNTWSTCRWLSLGISSRAQICEMVPPRPRHSSSGGDPKTPS